MIGAVCLAAFLWIYTAIKRSGVVARTFSIYVETDRTFHIRERAPVLIHGFMVGKVSDIQAKPDKSGKILLTLDFTQYVSLPTTTTAVITYTSITGGRQVNLIFDKFCTDNCLVGGETIPARVLDMPQQIADATAGVRHKVDSVLNSYPVEGRIDKLVADTRASLERLRKNTEAVEKNLIKSSNGIVATAKNIANTTNTTRQKMPDYMKQLDSLNAQLSSLRDKRLDKTIQGYTLQADSARQLIVGNSSQIDAANDMIDKTTKALQDIRQNKTVQNLLFNDSTAIKAGEAVQSTQSTLRDVYTNPEKYRKLN